MKYLIITNTFHRNLELVKRSIDASLREIDHNGHLLLIDQNPSPLNVPKTSQFTHLHILKKSVSSARNTILTLEWVNEYDWLIFCDDDGRMDQNYIETLIMIINNNPDLQVIAGSIIRDDNLKYYSPRHRIGGTLKKFRYSKLLMGSNFAVKKDIFYRLKGFDEKFGAGAFYGSGEETDFCWKCYFSNIKMEFFRELRILHIKPYAGTLDHSLEKAYKYGFGKGALCAKWFIKKSRPIILYEIIEMLVVPTFKIFMAIFKLKPNNAKIAFAAIKGRIKGFFFFLFQ